MQTIHCNVGLKCFFLVHFFCDHSHSTKYGEASSANKSISASIVQGLAVGPVAYVINTGDLVAVTPGNRICKYADDTYVIVPAANSHTRNVEVANTEQWATTNNLTLNQIKLVKIFSQKNIVLELVTLWHYQASAGSRH